MRIINNNLFLNDQAIEANYDILPTDDVLLVDATSGAVTLNLPSPLSVAANNTPFVVKKIDASANAVTIASGDNIDGAGTLALTTQYETYTFFTDGITWYVIATNSGGGGGGGFSAAAWSANLSANQSIANNTLTQLQLATVLFDTNSEYDNATYLDTPKVAGYYEYTARVHWTGVLAANTTTSLRAYKNGVIVCSEEVFQTSLNAYSDNVLTVSAQMNGTTDNMGFYVSQNSGAAINAAKVTISGVSIGTYAAGKRIA